MKNFIYLIQGSAENIEKFFFLKERKNSDVIFLTYDKKLNDCEFLPNSTWAEGRNYLLELKKKNFLYTIFCDDDIEFIKGSWDMFEQEILRLKPKIAVPIVPKTRKQTIAFLPYQYVFVNDEQMVAYHNDVIQQKKIFPLVIEFDNIHWWASCEIHENLIQHYYANEFIQINSTSIDNIQEMRYLDKMNDRAGFQKYVKEYLEKQNIPYGIKHIKIKKNIIALIKILFKTFKFYKK